MSNFENEDRNGGGGDFDEAAEQERKRKRNKKRKRVEAMMAELVPEDSVPDGYSLTWRGVKSEGAGLISDAPFWVSYQVADPNGKGRTLVIAGITTEQRLTILEVPFGLIYSAPGQLAAMLSSSGLRIRSGAAAEVAMYINANINPPLLTRVHQPGWVGDPREKLAFALRDRVIGGDGFDLTKLQESKLLAGMEASGTLEEWKEHVAAPADAHPVVAVSIMLPFAATLLRLLDADGFGLLLRGGSSTGKTSALMAMASVFGRAVLGHNSFVLSFNSTTNAIEVTSVSRNDIGMPMDELGAFDGPGFSTLVYRIPGGVGKGRLGRDGNLREGNSWRTILLGTSERRADELLAEDTRKGRIRAGQSVRLMNIETDGRIFVADSVEEAKAAVHALRAAVSKYHGTAGPAFVERLIAALENPDEDAFTIENLQDELDSITGKLMLPDLEPHQQRAVRQLAIIALGGTVACMLDVLPYDATDVLEYVKEVRDMYLASGAASDGMVGLRRLRDYLIDNAERFVDVELANRRNSGTKGYFWEVRGVKYYLFSNTSLREAAGVTGLSELLQVLVKYDLTHRNNGKNKGQSRVPAPNDCYADHDERRRQMSMYCVSEHLMSWRDDQPFPTKDALFPGPSDAPNTVKRRVRRHEDDED